MSFRGSDVFLGVDSPFFSTIVLFKNRLFDFPWVFDGVLKRRIPGFRMGEVALES